MLDKLRTLRKGAGITQVELAERLGRPQSYVAKIEGGERRMDVLEFIDWLEAVNAADQLQPLIQDLLAIRASANEDKR
ncbi:helix-turn-helix domain-containing protein [Paenirhodobacter enshiensis]|uniref:helix-turn-helix domain-containing protein n=1 Tax=Paenirhodobacter enshiensis TaxID=1105367 RepID=UPI001FE16793|nr:helix-turn-helix transcriptional regulator [Paenirhodobacter enshiensis]